MNGLRYIRRTCNLTISELAKVLGVSRQAISSWENNKKRIPDHRLIQLSDFFGLDKAYFEEITDKEQKELWDKEAYRYKNGDKEYYTFRDSEDKDNKYPLHGYLDYDSELTLDEQYRLAIKRKEDAISKVEEMMAYYDIPNTLRGKITAINRGCSLILPLIKLMDEMPKQELVLRMAYYDEIYNVLNAMLLANGLITVNDIYDDTERRLIKGSVYDGTDFILELSEMIKKHQNNMFSELEMHIDKLKEGKKESGV